ncbi:MAG: carboxypeptidase regulatory-like domain-containing protein [Bacteroidota bacterium]|nr:carboxypeptidase regulatory-like domain-containing protein [Bacteroidota bacterium]
MISLSLQPRAKKRILVFALVMSFFPGCISDVPHDNPLDPQSPKFENAGTVRGRVLSLGSSGIANAVVSFTNSNIATLTDNNGNFSADHISAGTMLIIVTKDGFLPDSISLQLAAGQTSSLEIHLDALPQISSQKIITKKTDQWWPGPTYSALVTAAVSDPDGQADIDTVFVTVDSLQFGMTYSNSDKNYQTTIFGDSLPGSNLQSLIGKTLRVFAKDKERALTQSGDFFISRIIEATAVPTSPTSQDTVRGTLYFQWDPPSLNFSYTFSINIYTLDGGVSIWFKSNIASAPPFAYTFPDTLTPRSYYWTVTVIDEFGNGARSKEASFVVPNK